MQDPRSLLTTRRLAYPSAVVLLLGIALPTSELSGQDRSLVDRVAAQVGDSVIVLSQIEERVFELQSGGVEIPQRGSDEWRQLQRDILTQMIDEQLIVQAAIQDTTITVDDLEIEDLVADEIDARVTRFGGQEVFEQGLAAQGLTLPAYRDYLRGQIRRQRYTQQYMAKRSAGLASIIVEESEIQEFFEEQRDVLGERPPVVEFAQIILVPAPSDSLKEAALTEANRIRQLALEGGDFAELAREYSQDPGSKENGGDLGWFRRGSGFVQAFEDAAFATPVNQISQPVETQFGFHIIKVNRRQSGEVRASHILIPVSAASDDVQRARAIAEEVKGRLEAGEPFSELRTEYGDVEEPDSLSVPFNQLRELPPGYAEPLSRADGGEVLGPIEYSARGNTRLAVVEVVDVLPAGPYSLDDPGLRDQILQNLQQQKLVEQILEELRTKTYIQIRM
jgi:peptidyl-prolyl cis-trans isomerase SurA